MVPFSSNQIILKIYLIPFDLIILFVKSFGTRILKPTKKSFSHLLFFNFFAWLILIAPFLTIAQSSIAVDSLLRTAEKNIYKDPIEARRLGLSALDSKFAAVEQQGRALKIVGGSYFVQGNYDLALEKFLDAFQVYEGLGDTTMMSQLLSNVGLVYKSIDDYASSLNYYRRALKIVSVSDTSTNARLINNVAVVYQHIGQLDTAQYFLEQSLVLKTQLGDKKGMANTLTNLGIVAFQKEDFYQAIAYHRRALAIETTLKHDEGIAKCMNNIGSTFVGLGNYDSAAYYAKIGLEIGQRLGTKEQIKQAYETLTLYASAKKDFTKAYMYQSQLMQIKDSLMNEDISRQLGRLESKLELASKAAEIEQLSLKNELADARLSRSRIQLLMLLLVVLGTLIFIYITAKKRKAEKLTQLQEYELLQKRFIEILNGPQTFALEDDLENLNTKLVNPLTEREYDALKLSMQGLSNSEIADQLFVSSNTVKFHLKNIYNKLGVSNRKEALAYVIKKS